MKKIRIGNLTITINIENIICDIITLVLSTIAIESLYMILKLLVSLIR